MTESIKQPAASDLSVSAGSLPEWSIEPDGPNEAVKMTSPMGESWLLEIGEAGAMGERLIECALASCHFKENTKVKS